MRNEKLKEKPERIMTLEEISLAVIKAISAMRSLGHHRMDDETRNLALLATKALSYVAGYAGLQDPRFVFEKPKSDLSKSQSRQCDRDGDPIHACRDHAVLSENHPCRKSNRNRSASK